MPGSQQNVVGNWQQPQVANEKKRQKRSIIQSFYYLWQSNKSVTIVF